MKRLTIGPEPHESPALGDIHLHEEENVYFLGPGNYWVGEASPYAIAEQLAPLHEEGTYFLVPEATPNLPLDYSGVEYGDGFLAAKSFEHDPRVVSMRVGRSEHILSIIQAEVLGAALITAAAEARAAVKS